MKYTVAILLGLGFALVLTTPEPAQLEELDRCNKPPVIHNLTNNEVEVLLRSDGRWEVDIKPKRKR